MIQLCLFNMKYPASDYGIGTYFKMITDLVKNKNQIKLNVIELGMTASSEIIIEEKEGIRFFQIPGSMDKFSNLKYCRNILYILKLYIDENEEDKMVFHLNFMDNGCLADNIRILYPTGKIILTVHYNEWIFPFLGNFERFNEILTTDNPDVMTLIEKKAIRDFEFEKKLLNNCDRIIAIAAHSYQKLQSLYGINASKITLIPNGLKDDRIQCSEEEKRKIKKRYKIDEKEKIILFVGRLSEGKGIRLLIDAFNQLLDKHLDLRLFIVGSGNLKEIFSHPGAVNSKITFTGFLNKEDVFKLYSIADMGIVPSFYEEFGYVAVEMMMHQLPVIVNNTSGLSEIVTDGKDGLYVNLGNDKESIDSGIRQLTQAMERLLADDELRNTLAENARRTFLEKYELNLFRERMLHFYTNNLSV